MTTNKDEQVMSYYTKVSLEFFKIPLIIYFIINLFTNIVILIDFKFKGNKGKLYLIKKSLNFLPLLNAILMLWIFALRHQYEVKVCFCDYKEAAMKLEPSR